jgi:hypothetical protein
MHFVFGICCALAVCGPLFAQQAPPVYVVVSPGSFYRYPVPIGITGGPAQFWPSLNFTFGDPSTLGIAVTSSVSAAGGTVSLHMGNNASNQSETAGGFDIYVRGGPGTPFRLQWSCTAAASATVNQASPAGLYDASSGTTNCAGSVDVLVDSFTGPNSLQNSVSNSGTINGTTSGQTILNPAFPGVTYSYATSFGTPDFSMGGLNVGGSGSFGIPYVGFASMDLNFSFNANIVRPGQTPPTAVIVAPTSTIVNMPITLDGSQSNDPDGDSIIEYRWDILNSSGGTDTVFGPTIQYAWAAAGIYSVTLTVTDSDGQTGMANTTVTVANGTYSCPAGLQILNVGLPAVTVQIPSAKGAQLNYKGLGLNFTQLGSTAPGVLCAAQSNSGSLSISLTLPLTGETFPFAQSITTATVTMWDRSTQASLTSCNFLSGVTNNCLLNSASFNSGSYYASWQSPGFTTTLVGQTTPFNTGPLTYWVDLSAIGVSASTPFDSVVRQVEPIVHTTLINNLPFLAWYSNIAYAIIQDPGVVSLLVVDASGSAIGYLPSSGVFRHDSPFAFYAPSALNPTIIIFADPSSGYQITITGMSSGSFNVSATTGVQGVFGASQATQGTVFLGQSQLFQFAPQTGSATLNAVITGDVNGDGRMDCADLLIIRTAFGKRTSQPGVDPRADVNLDGLVDIRDLAYVSQRLPTGTHCP